MVEEERHRKPTRNRKRRLIPRPRIDPASVPQIDREELRRIRIRRTSTEVRLGLEECLRLGEHEWVAYPISWSTKGFWIICRRCGEDGKVKA